jgi:hypothetical protein
VTSCWPWPTATSGPTAATPRRGMATILSEMGHSFLTSDSAYPCGASIPPSANGQAEPIPISPTRLWTGAGFAIRRQVRTWFAFGATKS